jgi:hypothetical protein
MRSSIFSSDCFRRYAALPRAERRWHARLAIVLALVAILCSQVPRLLYASSGCSGETLASAAVASLSDRTEVLFLGSSHFLFGIRPQQYSLPSTNLAATWLNYSCLRRVLEKHLDRVPRLKVAVIEYDELPLVADLVSAMIGAKDFRPLTEFSLTPFEFPASGPAQKLRTLWTAWLYPVTSLPRVTPLAWSERANGCPPIYQPKRGFAPGYYYTDAVTPPDFNARVVFHALTDAASHDDVVQRNLRDLDQTVSDLRHRGVTVVLLRMPHDVAYRRGRPAAVTARWRQLQNWARANRSVIVLDWGERAEFGSADFCDMHHLNVYGADKLAGLLDVQLRALCASRR